MCYLNSSITLAQRKFTRELLQDAGLTEFIFVVTSLSLNLKLTVDEGEIYTNANLYRCLVGMLNFIPHTRPDLAYTVQHLS